MIDNSYEHVYIDNCQQGNDEKGTAMKSFDIYISTDGSEATAHGAEYVYEGMNPADAVARFVADADQMREVRATHEAIAEVASFDDDTSASAFPLDGGAWELHVYDGESDTAITIPQTEFVSVTDAADMLDVSRQRVHAMLQGGQLDGRMVGSTWTVSRASVERRIAEQRKPFEQYELDAYLGEHADDFDVEAIVEDATTVDYRTGNRYWRDGIDLAEICAAHDLTA